MNEQVLNYGQLYTTSIPVQIDNVLHRKTTMNTGWSTFAYFLINLKRMDKMFWNENGLAIVIIFDDNNY